MTMPLDEVADHINPLETFYARNPEELSDEDLRKIVDLHRAERERMLAPKPKKVAAPKARKAK